MQDELDELDGSNVEALSNEDGPLAGDVHGNEMDEVCVAGPEAEDIDVEELNCEELEALCQRALLECPQAPEEKFQQLLRETMSRKGE